MKDAIISVVYDGEIAQWIVQIRGAKDIEELEEFIEAGVNAYLDEYAN